MRRFSGGFFAAHPIIGLIIAGTMANAAGGASEVVVPAGSYVPFYGARGKGAAETPRTPVRVAAFRMDAYPVTNAEFLGFVRANSAWRKSAVKPIFADRRYLERWRSDLSFAAGTAGSPVVSVSWFAAEAYCEWKGGSLPTTDQWEYAAGNGKDTDGTKEKILAWYARPSEGKLPAVGSGSVNRLGIHDLFGSIWEWTFDFDGVIQSGESRENGIRDTKLFCGSGSLGALDPTDYASFMRFGFRGSLKASYTVMNLGFRCVREVP